MTRIALVAFAVATALAVPAAHAAGEKAGSGASAPTPARGGTGAYPAFDTLDANKDGSISREEARGSALDKDFATLDKNRDGKLSADEHAGGQAAVGGTAPPAPSPRTAPQTGGPTK